MKKRLAVLLTVLVVTGATIVACGRDGSSPTLPAAPQAPSRLLGLQLPLVGSLQLPIITRLVPLSAPVTWSFVASPLGSKSTNLTTGLTVIVPAGAVSVPTTITVTAEAGAPVAYDFQPAGLKFKTPITLVQDMSLTDLVTGLLGATPQGAYFASSQLQYDSTTGLGTVNELEPTTTNLLLMQTRVSVSHFSGYTFATSLSGGM